MINNQKRREGKITIRHFANERLLPFLGREILNERLGLQSIKIQDKFPLYIKVNVKNQQTIFKSKLNLHVSVEELETPSDSLKEKIAQDRQQVETIVRMLKPFERDTFLIREVKYIYEPNAIEVHKLVSKVLFRYLKELLPVVEESIKHINDESLINENKNILIQIKRDIALTRPNIYSLFLNFQSLKGISKDFIYYQEVTFAFSNIYNFLFFRTKNRYYIEDIINKRLFIDLHPYLNIKEIKQLEIDLNHMLRLF